MYLLIKKFLLLNYYTVSPEHSRFRIIKKIKIKCGTAKKPIIENGFQMSKTLAI